MLASLSGHTVSHVVRYVPCKMLALTVVGLLVGEQAQPRDAHLEERFHLFVPGAGTDA